MRILVIEDDERIRSFISNGLRQEGHVVDDTPFGKDGLTYWENVNYAAVILDLALPEMDGMSILETMRKKGDKTPAIIVSAKKTIDDRVKGLQSGADDYLTKPFSFSELLARLHVVTRRKTDSESVSPDGETLTVADITLNLSNRTVLRLGKKIDLKPKEFALLDFMMRNANRILAKEVILRQMWDFRFDPQSNIVDALVCRLRNKIDADFDVKRIQTRRGTGYVFVDAP
jgi:DNA-binding response OmpR family regulator